MACLGYTVLLCIFAIALAEKEPRTVVVETDLGPVRGLIETVPGTEDIVQEFRGIRYGKSTSGPRRFKKPEPFGAWSGELDGTKFAPACSQMALPLPGYKSPEMSEDCLALNIYVPTGLKEVENLSVMVWIYGGAMIVGHSHQYDGKQVAVDGGVIVVTINYRLGLFGFLALDHPAAKGNYAVWDQKLALHWIHDNIGAFGGDPNSVTVFGESAGGWSTNVQALIPSNKGLFQRAIAQSGALDFGRLRMPTHEENLESASYVANKTGCVLKDQYKFVDCLRSKSEQELLDVILDAALEGSSDSEISIVTVCPRAVIDGELFKEDPLELLEDSNSDVAQFFKSIQYMSGVTSQEGSLLPFAITPRLQEKYGFNITDGIPGTFACEVIVRPYVKFYFKNHQEMEKLICEFYEMEGPLNERPLAYLDFYGDLVISHPVNRMIDYHASLGGLTWQYVFSRPSPIQWGGPFPSWFKGAGHADDLFFMFPAEPIVGFEAKLSEDEKELSKTYIQYWTSFAKFGVPSGGEKSAKWDLFNTDTRHYMDFDIPIKQKSKWAVERTELWNKIIETFKDEQDEKNKHMEL